MDNYLPTKEVGYVNYPLIEIEKLERKWMNVESRAATAFCRLDNGDILKSQKDMDSIKLLLALHYMRSISLLKLIADNERKYFEQAYQESCKSNPAKTSEYTKNKEIYYQKWLYELRKLYPSVIKSKKGEIEKFIMQFNIEIGVGTGGTEFYLSDVPVINMNDAGNIGINFGVDITQSTTITMPLGPRHIVALTSSEISKSYKSLNNYMVKKCNEKILLCARTFYYSRPRRNDTVL